MSSGDNRQNAENPHESKTFLPTHLALDTGLIQLCPPVHEENKSKRTSKTALLNDKFSRAIFCLSDFFFRQEILDLCFVGASERMEEERIENKRLRQISVRLCISQSGLWPKTGGGGIARGNRQRRDTSGAGALLTGTAGKRSRFMQRPVIYYSKTTQRKMEN